MCFINTKTNGCQGRRKDVACIFVLGGAGCRSNCILLCLGGDGGGGGGGGVTETGRA